MTELQAPAAGSGMQEIPSAIESASAPPRVEGGLRLPLSALVPTLYQPRKTFKPGPLQELAENIRTMDVLQPILVRRLPASRLQETWTDRRAGDPAPTHEIVAGERRWRAAKLAGLKTIPYVERELTDAQVAHMALAENIQREDLHPLEEAEAYRNILDLPENAERKMEERMADLAGEVKKSTRYVYQTLQLLKLCEFTRQVFLEDGKLHRTIALEIATIGNEAQQIEATRRVCGLARQGTDVVDNPMSHRAAAEYIRNNFRLVLSKAPFPVKVEFASVGACTGCEKMSANARELFDEGAKVPDTCMDPSCYGKKSTAHFEQIAAAAKKEGQRVITGKEAKKLLPYDDNHIAYSADYEALDNRRYEGKCDGKTVKQLLGNDIPKPVLIQRPDGKGFIEALPKKDVERLLKERGLLAPKGAKAGTDPQREAEKKAKKMRAYREALAAKLLEAVGTWTLSTPVPSDAKDSNALLSKMQLLMGIQLYGALDNESSKRLCKLMDWEPMGRWGDRNVLTEKLQAMDGVAFNRYVVACLIAGEIQVPTWSSEPKCEDMDDLAALLEVDAKALKADMERAEKDAAKAAKKPAAPAAKKAAGKTVATTTDDTKVSITVWRHATEKDMSSASTMTDARPMAVGQRVRVCNADFGLSKNRLSDAGREGILDMKAGDAAWYVKLPDGDGPSTVSRTFHVTELMLPVRAITQLEVGLAVRFRQGLKGHTHDRKCSGRMGSIAELKGLGGCLVHIPGYADLFVAEADELEAFEDDIAPPVPAKKTAAKKAPKKKPDPAKAQLAIGGLEQPAAPAINPVQAWPFPTAPSKAKK